MTTPKILFQTWKDRNLPEKFKKNRDKWMEFAPESEGWQHVLLTDQDLRLLVSDNFPQYLSFYDSLTIPIERVDFARYVMMWLGGVYADLDTFPLKKIDPWITDKIVLGTEPEEHAIEIYSRKAVICNAFMMSPPSKDFWIAQMDYIVKNYEPNYKPVFTTGPMAMTKFIDTLSPQELEDIIITDPCVFFPLLNTGKYSPRCKVDQETYVVHQWENTWVPKWTDDPRWYNKRYHLYGAIAIIGLALLFMMLKSYWISKKF